MENLISSLTADDLPNEDVKFLADIIGLDAVKKLLQSCSGLSFYIPRGLSTEYCKRYILAHYNPNENNVRAIAIVLGITERNVYQLLRSRPRRA